MQTAKAAMMPKNISAVPNPKVMPMPVAMIAKHASRAAEAVKYLSIVCYCLITFLAFAMRWSYRLWSKNASKRLYQ